MGQLAQQFATVAEMNPILDALRKGYEDRLRFKELSSRCFACADGIAKRR